MPKCDFNKVAKQKKKKFQLVQWKLLIITLLITFSHNCKKNIRKMSLEVFTCSITKNTLHHVFFAYELSENFRITLNSFIPKLLKSLAENIKQNIF